MKFSFYIPSHIILLDEIMNIIFFHIVILSGSRPQEIQKQSEDFFIHIICAVDAGVKGIE